jgi:hypothetical protein
MIPARQFVTSTNPFADDVQARLALPFFKQLIKPYPRNPPVLQPMPSLEDMPRVKGYFFGGLLSKDDIREKMKQEEEYRRNNPSIFTRLDRFITDPEHRPFYDAILRLGK